jgi:hypothetical protein
VKKAQAAMEYLMTYGWAILIIIVVVAALYGMGVFRIGAPPVPCSPCFSYFAYVDYVGDTLRIRNGAQQIDITAVTGASTTLGTYAPGDDIILTNTTWTTAGSYDITITYTVIDGLPGHTDSAVLHTG